MSLTSKRQEAIDLLIAARKKLEGKLRQLARKLRRKGIELVDCYGASPGEMDIWSKDESLLFLESYNYQGPEYGDTPETRQRTMGYHWQFRKGGRYLLHLQMVATRESHAQLRVLYSNVKISADKDGWQAFLAYLEKERLL